MVLGSLQGSCGRGDWLSVPLPPGLCFWVIEPHGDGIQKCQQLDLSPAIPGFGLCGCFSKVARGSLIPGKGPFGEMGRRAQTQVTSDLEELEGWG